MGDQLHFHPETYLELVRSELPGADLRVALFQDPLPDGPFDAVISALSVHHLDGDEKADLFRRVRAVLAPAEHRGRAAAVAGRRRLRCARHLGQS